MIFNLLIANANSTIHSLSEMWKFALGGMLTGTILVFIAMKINHLSIAKFGSHIKTLLLRKGWLLRQSINSGSNTTKSLSERIFDDVDAILKKYRPEIRKEFNISPNEAQTQHDIYRMADLPERDAFGVMIWRNDGKGIHFQNLITDRPENLISILMERLQTSVEMVMKNMPREKAEEVLEKGFGGKGQVISGSDLMSHLACNDPDCPRHGKTVKQNKIGVA